MYLATVTVEGEDLIETVQKPMTKTEAYAWIKRAREGLREAERLIAQGGFEAQDVVNELNDASGSIGELLASLENDYDGNLVRGITGVTV